MKPKTILTLLLVAVGMVMQAQNSSSFTLQGNIEGLEKDDTLLLMTMAIPEWQPQQTDTFFVEEQNFFSIVQSVEHSQYYLLSYIPKGKEPLPTSIWGQPLFARPQDKIILNGSTEFFGTARIKGGIYDIPLIKHQDSLTAEYNKQGIAIYRKAQLALDNNMPDSIAKYGEMYNRYERSAALKELDDSLTYKTNDNEYAAYNFLVRHYDWNYTTGKARFDRFTPEVKASNYGKQVAERIQLKEKLEPGKTPPDFTLTTTAGRRVSLSDYKGKHLLLYWWGMCPGSFQLNPKFVELYKTYHEKGLEILAVTRENISWLEPQMNPQNDEEKEMYHLFFNPSWDIAYQVENDNASIVAIYDLNVLPTVMLISPEGKTLFRGYNDYAGLEKAFLNSLNK